MAITTFPVTLKWAHLIAPGVRHLAFDRKDGTPLSFIPGQFISIHFTENDKPIKRSYSIATIPNESEHIEIALSYIAGGSASEFLFNLSPGQEVQMSGPYGRLILRDEETPRRFILVATGTGVTPYRSMLPQFKARFAQDLNLEIYVLLGVRTHHDQLYTKDFLALAEVQPRFHFNTYYSREYPATPLPFEHSGYVQSAFPELNLDPHQGDLIYLCGNPHMVDNAVELLKQKEFAIQQIRREKYVS